MTTENRASTGSTSNIKAVEALSEGPGGSGSFPFFKKGSLEILTEAQSQFRKPQVPFCPLTAWECHEPRNPTDASSRRPEGPPHVMTDEDTSRALESDQRLAAHLRALSRLAPTTAHDMRTPLHTVVLYLELLRNTLGEPAGGDVKERQGRYVEVIGSELQRLEGMLDSILDQLRVTEDSAERFDLAETVRDLGILLDRYCRPGRVELRRASDGPVHVQGNKDSLKQALLHI